MREGDEVDVVLLTDNAPAAAQSQSLLDILDSLPKAGSAFSNQFKMWTNTSAVRGVRGNNSNLAGHAGCSIYLTNDVGFRRIPGISPVILSDLLIV